MCSIRQMFRLVSWSRDRDLKDLGPVKDLGPEPTALLRRLGPVSLLVDPPVISSNVFTSVD